jgi:hypothetical protein
MIKLNSLKVISSINKNGHPVKSLANILRFGPQTNLGKELSLGKYELRNSTGHSLKRELTRLNRSIK